MAGFIEYGQRAGRLTTYLVGNGSRGDYMREVTEINPQTMTSAPTVGAMANLAPQTAEAEIVMLQAEVRRRVAEKTGDDSYLYSFDVPVGLLDPEEQKVLGGRLDLLMGVNGPGGALENYGVRLAMTPEEAVRDATKPFGFFQTDFFQKASEGKLTANDLMFAVRSVRHEMTPLPVDDMGDFAVPTRSAYNVSKSHLRYDVAQHHANFINRLFQQQERLTDYVIFDVETAGLDAEGLTEVAARRFSGGREVGSTFFKVPNQFMRTGIMAGDRAGAVATAESVVLGKNPQVPIMEQYRGFKALLEQFEQANWQIVGQNIGFDLKQTLGAMITLPQYKGNADPDFVRLVDTFAAAIDDPTNFVDTRLLASIFFRRGADAISVDPELAARGAFSPISLENILKQSDLLDYILAKRSVGTSRKAAAKQIQKFLQQGTHTGYVDTGIEGDLFEYLQDWALGQWEGKFQSNRDHPYLLSDKYSRGLRGLVGGEPIAPKIASSDPSRLVSPLRRDMPGYLPGGGAIRRMFGSRAIPTLTPQEQSILLSHLTDFSGTTAGAFGVENATATLRDFAMRVFNPGGGFVTDPQRLGLPETFSGLMGLQRQLIEAGVPFGRQHILEREVTGLFGQGSALRRSVLERMTGANVSSRFTTDMAGMIARSEYTTALGEVMPDTFMHMSKAGRFNSDNIALPLEFVEEALGRKVTHLTTSAFQFEKNEEVIKDIALNLDLFEDSDIEKLITALGDESVYGKRQYGISAALAQDLAEGLRRKETVQIGTMFGLSGENNDLVDRFESLAGRASDRSRGQRLPFSLLVPTEREFITGMSDGQQRTLMGLGQAIATPAARVRQIMSRAQDYFTAERERLGAIRAGVSISDVRAVAHDPLLSRAARVVEHERRAAMGGVAREAAEAVLTPEDEARRLLPLAMARNAKLKKYGGIALGTAAVAGVGYYFYKHQQESSKIDETMDRQEYEDSYSRGTLPSYGNAARAVLPAPIVDQNRRSRRMEYMQTAGVTRRQYDRRIGHTNMGNDRYNHLYGG